MVTRVEGGYVSGSVSKRLASDVNASAVDGFSYGQQQQLEDLRVTPRLWVATKTIHVPCADVVSEAPQGALMAAPATAAASSSIFVQQVGEDLVSTAKLNECIHLNRSSILILTARPGKRWLVEHERVGEVMSTLVRLGEDIDGNWTCSSTASASSF